MSLRIIATRICAALPPEQQDPMLAHALWFLLWAVDQGHTAVVPQQVAGLVEDFLQANDLADTSYDLVAILQDWSDVSPPVLTAVLPDLLSEAPYRPILTEGQHIWLQRLFAQERLLARAFGARLTRLVDPTDPPRTVPEIRFGAAGEITLSPGQRQAVEAAIQHPMLLLTGGPGTGKTTVVAALLLALAADPAFWQNEDVAPPVLLAAPTGKAAGRMNEALQQNLAHVHGLDPQVGARLQHTLQERPATTLHRLLGASARPGGGYLHGPDNLLPPASVVVIDEASMIDLPLMTQLMTALDPDTRLLLLGDPHQLPAVGTGTVLADLAAAPALQPWHVHLRTSHRFREGSRIYALKQTILGHEVPPADTVDQSYVEFVDIVANGNHWQAYDDAVTNWMSVVRDADADASLPFAYLEDLADAYSAAEKGLGRFRVLCALRDGPSGQNQANRFVEKILRARYQLPEGLYDGQPRMLLQNSYGGAAHLFNGDIGFVRGGALQCEPRPGMPATIPLPSLPRHETCYATTVHKSQGSEFQHILLLLPSHANPVVTRELLYTAVTRVKVPPSGTGGITIVGPRQVYEAAIQSPSQRHTGLPALLEALR